MLLFQVLEILEYLNLDMNKAVFLDRDGIINKECKDYVKNVNELVIFPEIVQFIQKLKENNFLIVVITNQSPINRGIMTESDLNNIHQTIQKFLKNNGTNIDAFYYCPHKPDEGCYCRKPNPGLLIKAAEDFEIDLKKSWMIGNNDSDVKAGFLAGCKSKKINDIKLLSKALDEILSY